MKPGSCLLAAVALLTGCQSYQLGTGEAPPFDSVHVAPVERRALVPQAVPELTDALRSQLAGRIRLASREHADTVLAVTLVAYRRNRVASDPEDTRRAIAYELVLEGEASLVDTRDGRVYFVAREFVAQEIVYAFDGELIQAERQALPVLVENLARDLRDAILGVW